MLSVGDIQVYVSDFDRALKFWAGGLGLTPAEKEVAPHSARARLDLPDGGPSIHLFAPAEAFEPHARPEPGVQTGISFDVLASDFDATLLRLIENGGRQLGQVETYNGLRFVTIADPDGNAFDLLEAPAGASAGPARTEGACGSGSTT